MSNTVVVPAICRVHGGQLCSRVNYCVRFRSAVHRVAFQNTEHSQNTDSTALASRLSVYSVQAHVAADVTPMHRALSYPSAGFGGGRT